MVDGFSVIIGSYLVHLAALIVLISCIRVPEYTDLTRQSQANTIYWLLLFVHLIIGTI